MPETETLDPNLIVFDLATRQRQRDLDLGDIKPSIAKRGVINPVIVAQVNGEIRGIAGFRRTMCARELGQAVPIRWLTDLSPNELRIIELEENVKRKDLHWRDECQTYAELHEAMQAEHGETWTIERSAEELAIHHSLLRRKLSVAGNLKSSRLESATSFEQAYGILARFAERKAAAIVSEIIASNQQPPTPQPEVEAQVPITPNPLNALNALRQQVEVQQQNPNPSPGPITIPMAVPAINIEPFRPFAPPPSLDLNTILNTSFLTWAPTYSGPRFNFIHCDFPYGVNTEDSLIETYDNNKQIFWSLFDCLLANHGRLFSHSSHLLFWTSLRDDFYLPARQKLRSAGFHVIDRPIIWLKSDMRGAAPGVRGTQPRHVYEGAILASRGQRPLVKQIGDGYGAPSVTSPIHPTQKPEGMLRYFFSGIVDETTTMLDPTAGSGASLTAALAEGAKSALGLELDANYAAAANAKLKKFLTLREMEK